MHPLGAKRKQIIITCIIIAFISIALVSVYSIHLINNAFWMEPEKEDAIDIYDQKLQYDLGIAGDNYESRDLYTGEIYENDKIQIIKNIKEDRYDFVASKAKDILASYKFDDDKLSTITSLENIEIFEPIDEEYNEENPNHISYEKISVLARVMDPEIYILLFMKLNVEEQRVLIEFDNVQMLPGFEYTDIIVTTEHMNFTDELSKVIGTKDYYKIELVYKKIKHYVYIVQEGSLKIFYINNETHDMNGFTY